MIEFILYAKGVSLHNTRAEAPRALQPWKMDTMIEFILYAKGIALHSTRAEAPRALQPWKMDTMIDKTLKWVS